MQFEQKKWKAASGWTQVSPTSLDGKKAALVFAFGDRDIIEEPKRFEELRQTYPQAHIVLVSTSGNICGVEINDNAIITTAILFEKGSAVQIQKTTIEKAADSMKAGETLAKALSQEGLVHVLVFADGHIANGDTLVKGLTTTLPPAVTLSGGLAGDGERFQKTVVGVDAPPQEGGAVVVGFYGEHLK